MLTSQGREWLNIRHEPEWAPVNLFARLSLNLVKLGGMAMKRRLRRNIFLRQCGFQLMEMVIVLTVAVSFMSFGSRYIQRNLQQATNHAIAHQLHQVTRAAYQYVQDEYISLSNNPKPITIQQLKDSGFLYKEMLEINLYEQSYKIEPTIIKNDDASAITGLQVLVTTSGGRVIDEESIRAIANKVGAEGGYSSANRPGQIVGSRGGWEVTSSNAQKGHIASLTVVYEKDVMAN